MNLNLILDNGESATELSKEIGDLNLSYLLLAQKLVNADRSAAMYRLGISRELADLLVSMSLPQMTALAGSNFLLCNFRVPDHSAYPAVDDDKDTLLQQAHMAILMAGRETQSRAVQS